MKQFKLIFLFGLCLIGISVSCKVNAVEVREHKGYINYETGMLDVNFIDVIYAPEDFQPNTEEKKQEFLRNCCVMGLPACEELRINFLVDIFIRANNSRLILVLSWDTASNKVGILLSDKYVYFSQAKNVVSFSKMARLMIKKCE